MKLQSLIKPELCFVLDEAASRSQLLGQLADRIAERVQGVESAALEAALALREEQAPTSTPEGVAYPHAMYEGVSESFLAVAVLGKGVDFGHKGHPPSDVIFVLGGSPESAWQHVSILARLARICFMRGALRRLRAARDGQALYKAIVTEDALHGG